MCSMAGQGLESYRGAANKLKVSSVTLGWDSGRARSALDLSYLHRTREPKPPLQAVGIGNERPCAPAGGGCGRNRHVSRP